MTVTQRYHIKVTPFGELHAENKAEAVLLYVSTIAFPASLFWLQRVWKSIPSEHCQTDKTVQKMKEKAKGLFGMIFFFFAISTMFYGVKFAHLIPKLNIGFQFWTLLNNAWKCGALKNHKGFPLKKIKKKSRSLFW